MPSAHSLTDHEEIRRWAEARGARPTCVKGTGRKGDTGMIRLDFPGFSGGDSLQPISWGRWFESFDENNLALLVQDKTARGGRSNFNKLVGRETAAGKTPSRRSSRARRASSSRSRGGVKRASTASQRHTAGERTPSSSKRTTTRRAKSGSRTKKQGARRSRNR